MHAIDLTIPPREKDLGGLSVKRLIPYAKRRMVGPFIFLDHMGPADFVPGQGIDIRPHPHIGLATVTYLFSGTLLHRDSLGSEQVITPGAVNWMTAGRGIAHSERTDVTERAHSHLLHGMQSWVALPKECEETTPEFFHHEAQSLPGFSQGGVQMTLICGRAYGYEAPVKLYSPMFYVEAHLPAGTQLTMPGEYRERALYVVAGKLRIGGAVIEALTMPVFAAGETITVESLAPSHVMLMGGDSFAEPRYIEWNFVSSAQERIEQAKADWKAHRFPLIPGDAHEFIPLPE